MGGVGNPLDEFLAFELLKALAMAITAATVALPEFCGTGIRGGGTGKWLKLEPEVALEGVKDKVEEVV